MAEIKVHIQQPVVSKAEKVFRVVADQETSNGVTISYRVYQAAYKINHLVVVQPKHLLQPLRFQHPQLHAVVRFQLLHLPQQHKLQPQQHPLQLKPLQLRQQLLLQHLHQASQVDHHLYLQLHLLLPLAHANNNVLLKTPPMTNTTKNTTATGSTIQTIRHGCVFSKTAHGSSLARTVHGSACQMLQTTLYHPHQIAPHPLTTIPSATTLATILPILSVQTNSYQASQNN